MQENDNLTFMTQTTLSLDDTAETIAALKEKYPAIQGPHKKRYLLCDNQSSRSGARIG